MNATFTFGLLLIVENTNNQGGFYVNITLT